MASADIVKATKKRIYTAYHEDGLIDVFVGSFPIIFSMLLLIDLGWMAGIWFVLIIPMYATAKNVLTVPRIGYVKLEETRRKSIGILLGSVLAVFGLFVFAFFDFIPKGFWDWMEANFIIIAAVTFALILLTVGVVFHVRRFFIYAIAALGIIPIGDAIGLEFFQVMLILGIVIEVSGMIVIYQFIRSHPRIEEGSSLP
jgi:hypothetical protein